MIDLGPLYWEPVPEAPRDALRDVRLELHWAIQVLAAFGQRFVPERSDDRHRSARWSEELDGFVTDGVGTPPVALGLRPEAATLVLLEDHEVVDTIRLSGRTLDEVLRAVESGLAGLGRLGEGDRLELPDWEMPEHPVGTERSEARFSLEPGPELVELAGRYRNAAGVLDHVRVRLEGCAVRCWPHHFDLATLIELDAGREFDEGSEEARSIGVGYVPGDTTYPEPYWYVNVWPSPESPHCPDLHAGHWRTTDWVGAVLTRSELGAAGSDEDETMRRYLESALTGGLRMLGAEDRVE